MKRFANIFILALLLSVLCLSLSACNDDSANSAQNDRYTHSIKIDSEDLFNYYFSYNITNSYSPGLDPSSFINFDASRYGTKSTSTISITPKLTRFVEYEGYVEFVPETKSENKSTEVMKNRHIKIDSWDEATDVYALSNETFNDSTISFDVINYKFYVVDIIVTYHHEGTSGDKNLSYKTIIMTNYNYKSYLNVSIENKSYSTTNYAETDRYHVNPIYTYHYYQIYTVTPSSQLKGLNEFNNITLSFDNGVNIKLDALGRATYKSEEYDAEKAIPKLSKIVGCIDFYPSATYEY